jgi:hypothetical protein
MVGVSKMENRDLVLENVRHLRFTVREFVESFVGAHVQRHATFPAFETAFVPCLNSNVGNGLNL